MPAVISTCWMPVLHVYLYRDGYEVYGSLLHDTRTVSEQRNCPVLVHKLSLITTCWPTIGWCDYCSLCGCSCLNEWIDGLGASVLVEATHCLNDALHPPKQNTGVSMEHPFVAWKHFDGSSAQNTIDVNPLLFKHVTGLLVYVLQKVFGPVEVFNVHINSRFELQVDVDASQTPLFSHLFGLSFGHPTALKHSSDTVEHMPLKHV